MDFKDVPDYWMLVLMAVIAGELLDAVDGEPALRVGEELVPVSEGTIDGLEEREWITTHGVSRPEATEKGKYAAKRWLVIRCKVNPKDFERVSMRAVYT